jgi:3-hydroxyisobutyrate dehydrogenase
MKKIGFIGLGVMGQPMAAHLVRAGHLVKGFDVSPNAVSTFVGAGGTAASSIADAVKDADMVFTMLPAARQAFEVYEGDGGIFSVADSGQILVDSSTLGVPPVKRLHEGAKRRGLKFLDIPVTGASPAAVKGTLVFIAGGEQKLVDEVRPVLMNMGSKCVYAGPAGSGQAIKICNNMAAGVIKTAICEAFALVEKLGIDPKTFFEVASQGSAQSFALNVLCPYPGILENAPSSHGYQGGFATRLMLKDMTLACEAAKLHGAAVPVTEMATRMFEACADHGYGDLDNAVLLKYLLETSPSVSKDSEQPS